MRRPLARAASLLLLVVVLAGSPAPARGQRFAFDLKEDPVPVIIIKSPKAGGHVLQATLHQLTDKEVKFKLSTSNRLHSFYASRVQQVETAAVRFVYDPKGKCFDVVVKGRPGGLVAPTRPVFAKPTRLPEPRKPSYQEPPKPEKPKPSRDDGDEKDASKSYDRAMRDYEQEVERRRAEYEREVREYEVNYEFLMKERERDYQRRLKEAEEEHQKALRDYAAKLEAYQKQLAVEKKRVAALKEQIKGVEKQFDGRVRFEGPIDGHTKVSVEALRDLLEQAEQRQKKKDKEDEEERRAELERKAASYLASAKKLLDQGETRKAHERIREVAEKFPETKAGVEARQLLEEKQR